MEKEKQLTTRQRSLLFAVIKEYCDSGESIGSKELKDKYGFDFSPATIRNEFSRLRELGYLYQPFTNASSQPSEKAFKLFINQLILGLKVTNEQQKELKKHILELEKQQSNLNKEISRLLALQAGGVGFAVDKHRENITGISNLLVSPTDARVSEILDFLDNLDTYKKPLLEGAVLLDQELESLKTNKPKNKSIKAVIGSENPILPLGKGYAMVTSEVLVRGEKNVYGLIAPTHVLAKKKNLELIDALTKALSAEEE